MPLSSRRGTLARVSQRRAAGPVVRLQEPGTRWRTDLCALTRVRSRVQMWITAQVRIFRDEATWRVRETHTRGPRGRRGMTVTLWTGAAQAATTISVNGTSAGR